jgi:hypothetical protein
LTDGLNDWNRELRSFHSPLPDTELRRIAENTWRKFCKHGWPRI